MKKAIRTFNAYNNGSESKLNVHFEDGSQFTRTITAYEAALISKTRDRAYLEQLMEKYAEPQKMKVVRMSSRGFYGYHDYWASVDADRRARKMK